MRLAAACLLALCSAALGIGSGELVLHTWPRRAAAATTTTAAPRPPATVVRYEAPPQCAALIADAQNLRVPRAELAADAVLCAHPAG